MTTATATIAAPTLPHLRRRLAALGYTVCLRQADAFGRRHAYRTTPSEGSGPTGYFDRLADLERYAGRVEWIREVEASLPPTLWSDAEAG